MGFYLRKSIKVGPLRFNLSKSGVGVSGGVRGVRVGTGPRGNYVHMGRGGLYYRKTLPAFASEPEESAAPTQEIYEEVPVDSGHEPLRAIESAEASQIVDSSSGELVEELNSKHKKWRITPWIMALAIAALYSTFLFSAPPWVATTVIVIGIAAVVFFHRRDALRKTTVLMYDIEDDYEAIYQQLHDAYKAMSRCRKVWHMVAEGNVTDRKRNAGADAIVDRNDIKLKLEMPDYVKTNVQVPSIPVGKQTLYFFPDKLLVYSKQSVGAVSYEHLELDLWSQRFIEDGRVPKDAKIVDRTWRYVNKSGGPDKRFNDNKELPIALYEAIAFKSQSGLNEQIQLSKVDVARGFVDAIRSVAHGYRAN